VKLFKGTIREAKTLPQRPFAAPEGQQFREVKSMSWNATQYMLFEAERTRPVRDLLAAISPHHVHMAADIGCGPGNSTEMLRERFPDAAIRGIDSSADMLAAARKRLPEIQFDLVDISAWSDPGPFDVILANAVLQWVPDHRRIIGGLVSKLSKGGILAIQMPFNLDEPVHVLMRVIAKDGPWASRIGGLGEFRVKRERPAWYWSVLSEQCSKVDIWLTTYHHLLPGGIGQIVEWFKGTSLQVFLDPLSEQERMSYLERYRRALVDAYPENHDGSVILPFPRLFMTGMR
jgi:trans-aconitate 2-methyltransferase